MLKKIYNNYHGNTCTRISCFRTADGSERIQPSQLFFFLWNGDSDLNFKAFLTGVTKTQTSDPENSDPEKSDPEKSDP